MNEARWRGLAEMALEELPRIVPPRDGQAEVRAALLAALDLPPGEAAETLEAILTSRAELQVWLAVQLAPDVHGYAPETYDFEDLVDGADYSEYFQVDGPGSSERRPSRGRRARKAIRGPVGGGTPAPTSPPMSPPPPTVPPPPMAPPLAGDSDEAGLRVVHPRLEAPSDVRPGETFTLVVGIARAPVAGVVAAAPFDVPTDGFTLSVQLVFDPGGFRTADGSVPVRLMESTSEDPFPDVAVELVALDVPEQRPARPITAIYAIDGDTLGTATISVLVGHHVPVVDRRHGARPVPSPVGWAIPSEASPDLVITLAQGSDVAGRRLIWSAHSRHQQVLVPSEPVSYDAPSDAADSMRRLMDGVEQRSDPWLLGHRVAGIGHLVGDLVPSQIWDCIASVVKAVPRPAVLLATDEPFVPWELAIAPEAWDQAWDPTRAPVLGAQVRLGRWIYVAHGMSPNPQHEIDGSEVAVVKGRYAGTMRLEEAESEADALTEMYGARLVPAELTAVLECIGGAPPADLLHFAVHGKLDATGTRDGIIMDDGSTLDPVDIRGSGRGRPRFVFINACQMGRGEVVLGLSVGVAPSFIRIGAQAVIAPLWRVDDDAAREFAGRLYAAAADGREIPDFLAEERARGAAEGADISTLTALAYVYFGHPRLTLTSVGNSDGTVTT